MRILCVDDEPDGLRAMSRLLALYGHSVLTARSFEEATGLSQKEKIDLLIADLSLPDGSGLDLPAKFPGTRGIALTGHAGEEIKQRCIAAGFAMHLVKPFDMAVLLRSIAGLNPTSQAAGDAPKRKENR